MFKGKFEEIVLPKDGFLRGPFGSALKKSLFVKKSDSAYKVYEQSVVLQQDKSLGNYYISREYFEREMSRFEVKSGDFLVSCSGVNYGAIFQLRGEIDKGVINQALLRIRINQELVDANYFLYYFKSYIVKKIIGGTGDSTIPNFPPMSVVKSIDIILPDIEIQRKIGKILAEIDNKIVNNNIINDELESMAKTIYDYWFLQFDFLNENGKPYKSSGGKMVWNEEMKREIPEGWRVKRLKDVGNLLMGLSPKSESYNDNDDGYPLINGAAELQNDKVNILKYTNMPTRLCQKNALIFCIRATIGNLQFAEEEYCLGRGVAAFTPKYKEYSEYMYNVINDILDVYKKILSGSIIVGITKDDLNGKWILCPADNIIKEFSKIEKPIMTEIRRNKKENQELASLRDFLLPLLMNGQVGIE